MRRTKFCTLTVMGLLVLYTKTWAANSPSEMIRSATNQVKAVLENPAYQGEEHQQERIKQVWPIVEPYFDVQGIAQSTLGVHWRERTEEERRQFVQLFTVLIEKTYSSALTRYTSDVQFAFDQERIDGDFSEVDTRLINPSLNKSIPIQYKLHRIGGDWRIYDVVIENVSLVRNYRNQFNRILSQSSYDELVQALKKKTS
jgi:phospholipid transport system substrate-binding protein